MERKQKQFHNPKSLTIFTALKNLIMKHILLIFILLLPVMMVFGQSRLSNKLYKQGMELFNTEKYDTIESIKNDGKYVVITMVKSFYDDMTAEDAKQQVEFDLED